MSFRIEQKSFKQKTVVEQVMEEIKSLIASGQFRVGEKIPPEMELAERFGVSRPTIREAIKVFNYLGVLTSQTGKGTYVADSANISTEALTWALLLGSNELNDLIELRELIETQGLKNLTNMMKTGDSRADAIIETLKQQIADMESAIKTGSKDLLNQADYNFHLKIIESGQNDVFNAIYITLQAFMLQQMHQTHEEAEDPYYIVKDHQDILDGICSKDTEKALASFTNHMQSRCFNKIRKSAHKERLKT